MSVPRTKQGNEALDEISKLFFSHIMSDEGISKSAILSNSKSANGIAEQLRWFVRESFNKHLPKSLYHEMERSDFELQLKPKENALAREIIEAFEKNSQYETKTGAIELKNVDVLNEIFGKFLADSFINEKQLGQYLTPPEVVKFMVSLSIQEMTPEELAILCDPKTCQEFGLVLDPSCGVGSFLTEFMRRIHQNVVRIHGKEAAELWIKTMVSSTVVGIDKSERMIRLALTNMATFGVSEVQLHLANSIAKSGPGSDVTNTIKRKAGIILTNPPFGAEFMGDDICGYKIANQGNGKLINKINSELLFLERYIEWLKPGGQLLAIVPDSILTNSGIYEKLRKQLSEQIELRSIISLPDVTFSAAGTNTKTSVLHGRKSRGSKTVHKTFFAICQDIGYSVRTVNSHRRKTTNGNGKSDLVKILASIADATEMGEYTRNVGDVETSRRWDANYHVSIPSNIQNILNNPTFDNIFVRTVSELSGDRTDPRRWGTGSFCYIEISDIDPETCIIRPKTIVCENAPSRARKLVKNGDVLFSTVRPERRTIGVVMEDQDGAVCSTGLAVLKPRGITSLVLANLLKSEFVIKQVLRNTLGIAYPAIDEKCLTDILLPISKDEIKELQDKEKALVELEEKIADARNDFKETIGLAILKWNENNKIKESGT